MEETATADAGLETYFMEPSILAEQGEYIEPEFEIQGIDWFPLDAK